VEFAGALRKPETVERFKQVPAQPGQTSPLLQYFGTLLTRGKLNAYESVELSKLVLAQNKKHLLDNWMRDNKLEPSEQLGDLLKQAGDNEGALKCYQASNATQKVSLYVLTEHVIKRGTCFLIMATPGNSLFEVWDSGSILRDAGCCQPGREGRH
jgi:hypothetical protein